MPKYCKKNLFILFFITSISNLIYSQNINGLVVDDENEEPLVYVTIAVKNKDKGTYTNQSGYFSLPISVISKDTLVFSSIGYATKYLSFDSDWVFDSVVIKLAKKDYILPEVLVNNEEKKPFTFLGNTSRKPNGFILGNVGIQRGILIKNPNSLSTKIKKASVYLEYVQNIECCLRLRIYEINEKEEITKELTSSNIIFFPAKKKGWIDVNLQELSINLPTYGCIVSVEWIKCGEENCFFEKEVNKRKVLGYGAILGTYRLPSKNETWEKCMGCNNWKIYNYVTPMIKIQL